MAVRYLWDKYNCVSTPIWSARQRSTTGQKSYSSLQKAAYVSSSGLAHPAINSSGQFTFTGGGTAAISTSNWSGKYWIANNDSVRLSTTTSSTSSYYAVITSCSSGFLNVKAYATIYEAYQTGTDYSKGSLIGEVSSLSLSAYPQNGRYTDGYWYVYKGFYTIGTLTASYNGSTLFTLQDVTGLVPVGYNGSTIAFIAVNSSKTLKCSGKYMESDVTVGEKTLSCGQKIMASDITISYSE